MFEDDFGEKHPAPPGTSGASVEAASSGHFGPKGPHGAVGGAPATDAEPSESNEALEATDEIPARAHELLASPDELEAAVERLVECGNLTAAASLLVEHDQPERAIDLLVEHGRTAKAAELLAEQGELTRGVDLLVTQGLIREAWELVFRERYEQYCKEARRKLSGNESVAKEACQNAFLELCKAFTHERSRGKAIRNIDALLRRLLTFAIMRAWNEQRTSPTVGAINSPKELEALEESRAIRRYHAFDARHDVHRMLEILAPRDREIFHLRFFERLKWDELGEELGIAASTARCRYSRALARLRKLAREPE